MGISDHNRCFHLIYFDEGLECVHMYSTTSLKHSEGKMIISQRFYAIGMRGLSPRKKCIASIRLVAYGMSYDFLNEYVVLELQQGEIFYHNFLKILLTCLVKTT